MFGRIRELPDGAEPHRTAVSVKHFKEEKTVKTLVVSLALVLAAASAEASSYTVSFEGHIIQSPVFSGSPDPTPYPCDPGIISVGAPFRGTMNWSTDVTGLVFQSNTNPDFPGQWIESGQVSFSWQVDMSGRSVTSAPAIANAEYLAILGSSPSNRPSSVRIDLDTRSAVQGNGSMAGDLFMAFWLGDGIAQSARWVEIILADGQAAASNMWCIRFEDNNVGPGGQGRDLIGVLDRIRFTSKGAHDIPELSSAWMLSLGLLGIGVLALKMRVVC